MADRLEVDTEGLPTASITTGLRYLVLAGPTASGKTELSAALAEHLRTEIVGCDAFQIYQGFDVLSAKPSSDVLSRVPHHLISALPHTATCDAHRYSRMAQTVIADLNRDGIVPLVVAGSGFYLRALAGALPELPGASVALREDLQEKPLPELLEMLRARDPAGYTRIDRANRRRVERALEVFLLSGRPFSEFLPAERVASAPTLLLERTPAELRTRIETRVDQMLAQGAIEEVRSTPVVGPTARQMIGIAAILAYLAGGTDLDTCRQAIVRQTCHYAKRQRTWFRKLQSKTVSGEDPLPAALTFFQASLGALRPLPA